MVRVTYCSVSFKGSGGAGKRKVLPLTVTLTGTLLTVTVALLSIHTPSTVTVTLPVNGTTAGKMFLISGKYTSSFVKPQNSKEDRRPR